MLAFSCLCGAVDVSLAARPDHINECNCRLCRATGARWSYMAPADVTVSGATRTYRREDKANAGADIHFCATCGAATHFTLTPEMVALHGDTVCGVNMWLADEDDLAGIELRFPDGRAWDGASVFGYVREPRVIGA